MEAYITLQDQLETLGVIARVTKENGTWSKPELTNFTSQFRDIEPFLSWDGLRLYFSSNRPLSDTATVAKDYDLWYVERKNTRSAWSKPVRLPETINTPANEFYPSVAKNGNLYFTSDWPTALGKDDIFFSRWEEGYQAATPLDASINSTGFEFNAFIAPDESYLLYTAYNRPEGAGSGDLYISYKNQEGAWQPAKNLGSAINSSMMDYCPYVDQRSKTLYFTSRRSRVTPKKFRTISDFAAEVNQYANGLSRIYSVPFVPGQ